MRSVATCALLSCVFTLCYAAVLNRSSGESACPAGARCAPLSSCSAAALGASADACAAGPAAREQQLCCWEAPSLDAVSDLSAPLQRRQRSPQGPQPPSPSPDAAPASKPSSVPQSTVTPKPTARPTPTVKPSPPRPTASSVTKPSPAPTASSVSTPTPRPTAPPTSMPSTLNSTPSSKGSPSQRACEEFRRYRGHHSSFSLIRIDRELQQLNVVGGEIAKSAEFIYMVAIGYVRGNDISNTSDLQWGCGGSLISDRYVLTAAHCITDAQRQNMRAAALRMGTNHLLEGPQRASDYSVETVILHPRHRPELKYFDLALLRTDRRVGFSDRVLPVCLPGPGTLLHANTTLVVAGWGAVDPAGFEPSADLKKAQLRVVDLDECKKFIEISSSLPQGLDNTMICAAEPNREADTCRGDSGGPLAIRSREDDVLVGVTSFGARLCAGLKPGVYARVLPELRWIESVVWS